MKHFEIQYFVGNHTFIYECTTAHEAYAACMDIVNADTRTFSFDADTFMEALISMKNGTTISTEYRTFRVRICDGEV